MVVGCEMCSCWKRRAPAKQANAGLGCSLTAHVALPDTWTVTLKCSALLTENYLGKNRNK